MVFKFKFKIAGCADKPRFAFARMLPELIKFETFNVTGEYLFDEPT